MATPPGRRAWPATPNSPLRLTIVVSATARHLDWDNLLGCPRKERKEYILCLSLGYNKQASTHKIWVRFNSHPYNLHGHHTPPKPLTCQLERSTRWARSRGPKTQRGRVGGSSELGYQNRIYLSYSTTESISTQRKGGRLVSGTWHSTDTRAQLNLQKKIRAGGIENS